MAFEPIKKSTKERVDSIYLIRHGETLGNVDREVYKTMADHAMPLSDRGKNQAEQAGKWLADNLEPCYRTTPTGMEWYFTRV